MRLQTSRGQRGQTPHLRRHRVEPAGVVTPITRVGRNHAYARRCGFSMAHDDRELVAGFNALVLLDQPQGSGVGDIDRREDDIPLQLRRTADKQAHSHQPSDSHAAIISNDNA